MSLMSMVCSIKTYISSTIFNFSAPSGGKRLNSPLFGLGLLAEVDPVLTISI